MERKNDKKRENELINGFEKIDKPAINANFAVSTRMASVVWMAVGRRQLMTNVCSCLNNGS